MRGLEKVLMFNKERKCAGRIIFNKGMWKRNFPPKGQIKFDFIFALVFFTILISYVSMQVNGAFSASIFDSETDTMKSAASSMLEILATTAGSPENWETRPPGVNSADPNLRIGLASPPYNISSAKLNALQLNCEPLMNKFGENINYKLIIANSTNILLSCGYGGPRVTGKSEIPVIVNGKYGKAVLEMW